MKLCRGVLLLMAGLTFMGDASGQIPDQVADPVARQEGTRPIPPRNTGPAAVAHSHTYYRRRKTVRVIRRTPEVMREDARRVSRGELFRTWSNDYLE